MQVSIAIEEVTRCHIRFTFRHRSSQECKYLLGGLWHTFIKTISFIKKTSCLTAVLCVCGARYLASLSLDSLVLRKCFLVNFSRFPGFVFCIRIFSKCVLWVLRFSKMLIDALWHNESHSWIEIGNACVLYFPLRHSQCMLSYFWEILKPEKCLISSFPNFFNERTISNFRS